ncbi:MAG: phospholipase D family protein [Verrucomicrobiota bacterium]
MSKLRLCACLSRFVLAADLLLLAVSCASRKDLPEHAPMLSLAPAPEGTLVDSSRAILAGKDKDQSAFLLLHHNRDALNWRLALLDHATTSIDIQYFIWDSDESSLLLFERLLQAADRGVRVRILVDDLFLTAQNHSIAALSRYPNIELKIYNPDFRHSRIGAMMEFVLYFKELNRRMHNKLFVVDNRFAIVGGRNIGDAYFGLSQEFNNCDMDVMATGKVVPRVSAAFDQYWNQKLAVPGHMFSEKGTAGDIVKFRKTVNLALQSSAAKMSSHPLERKNWTKELQSLPALMHYGSASFLQDSPVVTTGDAPRLLDMLSEVGLPSKHEVLIVSPYFIPTEELLQKVKAATDRGVSIKLLTGSLASNNHTLTHSHYKKYRRRILQAGAQLYEFRHDPSAKIRHSSDNSPVKADFISLHAKMIVRDRDLCYIGSLNLDPRSVEINTENGMLIDSPGLANQLAEKIEQLMSPENAWQVYLDEHQRLRWKSSEGVVSRQPARKFSQRISDFFFRLIPVEGQL